MDVSAGERVGPCRCARGTSGAPTSSMGEKLGRALRRDRLGRLACTASAVVIVYARLFYETFTGSAPMSTIRKDVLAANEKYAATFGDKSKLTIPPARGFAILTCMDARIDPAKAAGLAEGDAHVIRNAGGRASDDAIRSLVISHKLLGTREWFVVHHTNCGMELFTDTVIRGLLAQSLETAKFDGNVWSDPGGKNGSTEAEYIDWLTIRDFAGSVSEDVQRIRRHPLVPSDIPIYGYIYQVETGRLVEVPAATEIGQAR
jgi:carbonic anhydrase